MLVMPLMIDVMSGIMQERRVLENRSLGRPEPMPPSQTVEKHHGQVRDMPAVRCVVGIPLGHLHDAPAARVGDLECPCKIITMPRDVVDENPFTQRPLAEGDFLRAEQL